MARYRDSDALIKSIKRRAMIPETQNTFLEEDFLEFANEEMDIGIVPQILQYHEEFFVYTVPVILVANTSRYQIPSRAVGDKLREISYQDSGGNIFEMTRITIEDLPFYQQNLSENRFKAFYIEGAEVVLVPQVSANVSGSLLMSYYLRPNEIVAKERIAFVTGVDLISGNITVDKIPDNITVATPVDIVQTLSPRRTLTLDAAITSINSTTKTMSFDPDMLPPNMVVGDQIALSGECNIPQIPSDLDSMLAQRVAARCLEALGDSQGLTAANVKLQEMEVKTGSIIDNRVEGAPLKIVNRNSTLMSNRRRWW